MRFSEKRLFPCPVSLFSRTVSRSKAAGNDGAGGITTGLGPDLILELGIGPRGPIPRSAG